MKLANYIISALTGVIIGYLMLAFYEVSFGISNWTESSRFICVMLMLVFGVGGCAVYGFVESDQN